MGGYRRIAIAIFLAGAAPAAFSQAPVDPLRGAEYVVYSGDINGDGRVDLLVKAKVRVAIIDLDVLVPIILKSSSPTFVLTSSGNDYVLNAAPAAGTVNSSVWQPGGYELLYGDLTGAGTPGMIIRSSNAGGASFSILTSGGAPTLLQTLTSSSLGVDLGASGATTELADQDNDGRADLVVKTSGRVSAVFLADSNGRFFPANSNSFNAAWFGMLSSLASSDTSGALEYISPVSRDLYQGAFANMGSAVTALRATLSNFAAVEVNDRTATFVVDQRTNGVIRMHFVDFVYVDGRWQLSSF